MSRRSTYILSALIVVSGPLAVAFRKSSFFFDVFYSIKIPRPGKMIDKLHSFENQEAVLNYLNWQNIEWEVTAEKKVKRSFTHVGHIDKTITAVNYPFGEQKGTLVLSFNNDRLYRCVYRSPALAASKASIERSSALSLPRNSPALFDKNVTLEWQTAPTGEPSLVWQDTRLLREISRQN